MRISEYVCVGSDDILCLPLESGIMKGVELSKYLGVNISIKRGQQRTNL